MNNLEILTESHHHRIDKAIHTLLMSYDEKQIDRQEFIGNVMHMVAAVDGRNLTEVNTFINNPLLKQ